MATIERSVDVERRLGATVHYEPRYDPGRRLYTTDPDGHELELVEY